MKARHRSTRWIGALLIVMAAEVGAQDGTNTQRPLRPGQVRGPKFMVPVLKSNERGLGAEVGSTLRERMMGDYLATGPGRDGEYGGRRRRRCGTRHIYRGGA